MVSLRNVPDTNVYCPVSLSNEFFAQILTSDEQKYIDHIQYLAHLVIIRQLVDKRNKDLGGAPLKTQYLQNIIGRTEWKTVKDICQRHGIVTTNGSYIPGERSCVYRLGQRHAHSRWKQVVIGDRALAARVARWRNHEDEDFWDMARSFRRFRLFKSMLRWREGLTLDRVDVAQLCHQYEAELREEHRWKMEFGETKNDFDLEKLIRLMEAAAQHIWDGDWRKTICEHGRYHWNVSGLWRHLRPYLKYDGQSLVNIDVKCSQPLFLCLLMLDEAESCRFFPVSSPLDRLLSSNPSYSLPTIEDKSQVPYTARFYDHQFCSLPDDVQAFIAEVVDPEGDIYTHLATLAGCLHEPRQPVRKRNTFHILYGKNVKSTPYQKAMDEHYPNVMKFIRGFKQRHGYKALAQHMQKHESRWMYDQVCKRLVRDFPEVPVFTIHDSILTTPEHVETVKQVMTGEFLTLGVRPQLNDEDYGNVGDYERYGSAMVGVN